MERAVNVTFEECWQFIVNRCADKNFPLVQNREELEHVFNLMQGCESYLEVGTAEGNSLYVLAHALKPSASITYIDIDEERIRPKRLEIIKLLTEEGFKITAINGNSVHRSSIEAAQGQYDIVMIDAGHTFDEAYSDGCNYAPLASKYAIFHDVCLPAVDNAFSQIVKNGPGVAYKFIKSDSFGYGVIKR